MGVADQTMVDNRTEGTSVPSDSEIGATMVAAPLDAQSPGGDADGLNATMVDGPAGDGLPSESATQSFADDTPIQTPAEGPGDKPVQLTTRRAAATVRATSGLSPKLSPSRRAQILGAVFIVVPLLLWVLGAVGAKVGDAGALGWLVAAVQSSEDVVVVRPVAGAPSGALVLAIERRGDRIVATAAGSPDKVLWQYPTVSGGLTTLLGQKLDDTVLWIPRTGPYAPSGKAGEAALMIFTEEPAETGSGRMLTLSLMDMNGAPMWMLALGSGLDTKSVMWTTDGQTGRLAVMRPGVPTVLVDPSTGQALPPSP